MLPLVPLPFLLPLIAQFEYASAASQHGKRTTTRSSRHRSLAQDVGKRAAGVTTPAGGFETVGDSGVSAQMMFVGTTQKVMILDKTENNAMTVTGPDGTTHPAWGTSYDLNSNTATPMWVTSNTFCAGGFTLGNGSHAVFGGNQPVTTNGVAVNDKGANPTGANPYGNTDGGEAIRLFTPCDDDSCQWVEGGDDLTMTGKRWYPTVEGLADGSVVVIGGDKNGGYVSTQVQNNPTYEFFPKRGEEIYMDFLNYTVPVNLFPLTWLMPSGKLFLQAGYRTIMWDLDTQEETALPDMPHAVRVYPASAATIMLPLTPDNNYEPTLLFCGGSSADFSKSSDGGAGYNVTAIAADDTCVRITPEDANPTYTDDDNLPEARSMGNFIYLPDGTLWLGNGVAMGTAGYGDEKWSVGESYGQDPIYMPAIYDPNAPAGSRFSRDGLTASPHERMYHSTAVLLADGSLLVSGSNPNKDVTTTQWGTSYVVEKWYPKWFNSARPTVKNGYPTSLSYGGDAFNLTYTPVDKTSDPANAKVVIIRSGFSTHGMNFGQRYLELETSYIKDEELDEITLNVAQMPPNANLFQPGPAYIFLVIDGIPAQGELIMIGSGAIETQTMLAKTVLPQSQVIVADSSTPVDTSKSVDNDSAKPSTGSKGSVAKSGGTTLALPSTLSLFAFFAAGSLSL